MGNHVGFVPDELMNYDINFASRERFDSTNLDSVSGIESNPEPLLAEKWAEPDANSFLVRGPFYKQDRVKVNAGNSIGRLIAVDVVLVDKPIFSGMSTHPTERIQLALKRERSRLANGKSSDMPPFIFVVNIVLPGPPFYHGVFYYAVEDMTTIDGSNGSGSSLLCKEFLFGDSDAFRDRTFKLIPQIVQGNFMVRKAVGSTPAIMGTKLKQTYVRHDRYCEVILDCGSSPVAMGVIRLSLGYAKTLAIDMGFLLEGNDESTLPERIFGCVRMKFPEFGPHLRKVEAYDFGSSEPK
jgi:Protein ENHANCED DISEASE RESISTANCE 2, C-terminal